MLNTVLLTVIDLLLVLPAFLIIAILSPAFRGHTWLIFVLLLAAFQWMITARIVRGMTLSLKEREFVHGRALHGRAGLAIIFRHILPNMASLLIIDATVNVSSLILAEVGLSFFGFGVQPPDVSLGTLIGDYAGAALTYPVGVLLSRRLPDRPRARDQPGRRRSARRARSERRSGTSSCAVDARTSRRTRRCSRSATCRVTFASEAGAVRAVRSLSYDVRRGEVLGIVGESGSGKSVSSLAVMGCCRAHARVTGSVRFKGDELLGRSDRELSRSAAGKIAMIFQDPLSALTPVYTVGDQIAEAILVHAATSDATAARAPRDRAARRSSAFRTRAARDGVPARVLRRHAPARDDRDGHRERSGR